LQDFLSGETVHLNVTYGDGHEPVIPDVGTVLYTVLDHSGNPISGLQNIIVSTTPSTFQSTITIDPSVNVIDPSKAFERRTVFLRYQSGGKTHYQKVMYGVIPTLPFTASPSDVRKFLGVNKSELPDGDIDIFASYLFVRETFSDPLDLDDALFSGDTLELLANEAIIMRAAIDIIPSLQMRVAQSEKDGPIGFDRIKIKDFSGLLAEAYRRYNDALGVVGSNTVAVDYTLITVTQDVDPVTAGT